jgi:hypothetical protein
MTMTTDQVPTPDFIPDTLPELRFDDVDTARAVRPRHEVRVLDFKDGRSSVRVAHGPGDPSRVWLIFENQEFAVHLSVEEGIARQLEQTLHEVMVRFRQVRGTVDRNALFR